MANPVQVLNKVPKPNPLSSLDAFKILVTTHHEYKKIVAQEKTKREAIEAWKEVRLTDLRNQKEILKLYLEETFKERKVILDSLLDSLDKGIESGNMDVVNVAISGIINISKDSPLAHVDKLMVSLKDENTKMIEF